MSSLNIGSWTPDEVSKWVKGLGTQFEAYHQSFVDEEITGKLLLTINADYLKELSIETSADQNVILEAVHCLVEVDTCLQGETVHGQVVIVNEKTKGLIDQLEKEGKDASEGDFETSETSLKDAGQVYQLAKKLLSWLIRSPFSEMNACWPLKESVCRVVRDMTDESLLKNRGHLQENLKKLQVSFDNFLNEEDMHEVFKQPPILKTEEITLEGEGLGIGITTSHNIHTVNSVSPESPAGKNKNIKNGDEIVNVNNQCVIAWPQKNVVALMKSNPNAVSLTLKKLPPVEGPLNKPVDKQGTPLSEMDVVIDRSRITTERTSRVEMKEAGIKEETSLEMQAIENENEAEANTVVKVNERIEEPIKEESAKVEEERKQEDREEAKEEVKADVENAEEKAEKSQDVSPKEDAVVKQEEVKGEEKCEDTATAKTVEAGKGDDGTKEEDKKAEVANEKIDGTEPKKQDKVEEKAEEKVAEKREDAEVKTEEVTEQTPLVGEVAVGVEAPKIVETLVNTGDTPRGSSEEIKTSENEVKEDNQAETKEKSTDEKTGVKEEKKEGPNDDKSVVVNGETPLSDSKTQEESQKVESKTSEETEENKAKVAESQTTWYDRDEVKAEGKVTKSDEPNQPAKANDNVPSSAEVTSTNIQQNGETEISPAKNDDEATKSSLNKKPARPDLPKMKIGSVKNVTVKGANTKQVEIFSASKVVRREKKLDGTPNKRISCIELGEADCEGWLTKKSGGHGLTPTRWRRQWCVLKEEHMYYYKTSFDREAGGVFEVTGYNVSASPEVKKPFAFKCEKDGAKKYFFHADNEVDREMWIRNLNSVSRGEKKQKDLGIREQADNGDRKSNALKVAPTNRPRTSSVLAGIRFNYYDDDAHEERKTGQEPSSLAVTAQRINDSFQDGQTEVTSPDRVVASEDVLNISAGVEEDADTCEVVPVGELQDNKGTKGASEDSKDEGKNVDHESEQPDVDDEGGVKNQGDTSEIKSDSYEPEDTSCSEDSKGGVTVDKEGDESQPGAPGVTSAPKDQVESSEEKSDPREPGDISEVKRDSKEPEGTPEVKSEPKGSEGASEDCSEAKEQLGKSEKVDSEPTEAPSAVGSAVEAKQETKNGTVSEKTEVTDKTVEGIEGEKDHFKEVAESIKEADVNIDGTERPSAKDLLRKLSMNSQSEIMDKVVKLRVLKQSLKDKEQSMDAIEELLSSDVTPETIAEWRTKFESVVESSTQSNDLNENSQ